MDLVKLGGSLITNKVVEDSFCAAVTLRLGQEIRRSGRSVIVIHGTGSYGKPPAQKHGYLEGFISKERADLGVRIKHALKTLNQQVVEMLLQAGLEPIPLCSSAIFRCCSGRINYIDLDVIQAHLGLGLTPIISGDIVLDQEKGFAVCSSDLMTLAIAKELRPQKVILATDVDGVFNHQKGKEELVEEITSSTMPGLDLLRLDPNDVSGGMGYKVQVALEIARHGMECIILNGYRAGLLERALNREPVRGTRFPAHKMIR